MFVFVKSAVRKILTLSLMGLLATASWAQNATPQNAPAGAPPLTPMPQAPAPQHNAPHLYSDQNYANPKSSFPNVIAPYTSRRVPPPNLTNSARTDQLFRDGKIYLSINDAVAMALENNLDIVVQRYNLSIADTDILRTKSGQFDRGVNSAVVQEHPRRHHWSNLCRRNRQLGHWSSGNRRRWNIDWSRRRRCWRGRYRNVDFGWRTGDQQL